MRRQGLLRCAYRTGRCRTRSSQAKPRTSFKVHVVPVYCVKDRTSAHNKYHKPTLLLQRPPPYLCWRIAAAPAAWAPPAASQSLLQWRPGAPRPRVPLPPHTAGARCCSCRGQSRTQTCHTCSSSSAAQQSQRSRVRRCGIRNVTATSLAGCQTLCCFSRAAQYHTAHGRQHMLA